MLVQSIAHETASLDSFQHGIHGRNCVPRRQRDDLILERKIKQAVTAQQESARLLLNKGAPVSARSTNQMANTPLHAAAATRIDRVYPSADIWPSNTLRLYIYFSAPMSRGEVAGRLHILDSAGKELKDVLLPGQELWDPGNQRLTMTFDPGRIKRGLESNTKMGPPIAEGSRYALVIDRGWQDARGVPLPRTYRKEFRGGPAVRVPPDPKQWRITAPRAGTSAPLVVEFGRSMNYPLLQRMLQVTGPSGRIAGDIVVERNESLWRLTPTRPWSAGSYRLLVDADLEDVAGNRINQPFDIDVFEKVTQHLTTRTISVPFNVR